jgi:hypothetical protein
VRHAFVILALLSCGLAHAAKVPVSLVTPTQNTDGSALTDLAIVTVEWGTCGATAGTFGTRQAGVTLQETQPGKALSTFVYPSGITKVCVRAFAINKAGGSSVSSSVATKQLLPSTGKPVTLEKPIVISFNRED